VTEKPTLYKVLGANGQPIHGGKGQWWLPDLKRPRRRRVRAFANYEEELAT